MTTGYWLGMLFYMLQIYLDFSAYSDMAIGMGRMVGFHYLENFNYPYMATSVQDFWRRWHISLSSFFRDYVYIPLGGSRCSTVMYVRNIFIVWFLTGMWHGASWNYILWGLYFAVFLLLEKFVIKDRLPKVAGAHLRARGRVPGLGAVQIRKLRRAGHGASPACSASPAAGSPALKCTRCSCRTSS